MFLGRAEMLLMHGSIFEPVDLKQRVFKKIPRPPLRERLMILAQTGSSEASEQANRQIRLHDLGGIIIIDFIDMDERRNRQKVMQALEEALRSDRAPSKVLQFNDFGLVAITRKRVKQSLERTIGTPCPYCTATGYVKSVNTVCNEIYVEMRKITKQLEHSDVLLRVNPEVAKALKANNGRWLTEMEELTGKTIIVKSDPAVHQEQFDIN